MLLKLKIVCRRINIFHFIKEKIEKFLDFLQFSHTPTKITYFSWFLVVLSIFHFDLEIRKTSEYLQEKMLKIRFKRLYYILWRQKK